MHRNVNTMDSQSPTCFGTSWAPWWWHSRSHETCSKLCMYCASQFGACEFGLVHGIL